ncbi:hypothetical protein QBC47DRAFT_428288 [Echria macrotheca]|uniref:Uncharacterized protein n=1 Tax=Echria macrotheca TaxID=438768 RepID=A0AAJ0BQ44_9PEZI|nr:hypothetical protein QBC47DRAFT_428288 [Echria macrotheca]
MAKRRKARVGKIQTRTQFTSRRVDNASSDIDMLDIDSSSTPPNPSRRKGNNPKRNTAGNNNTKSPAPTTPRIGPRTQQPKAPLKFNTYHPGAETFNSHCPACAVTHRLNYGLRTTLDTLFRRFHDALDRWADDVGVGSGRSIDPMEWQAEMTTLVLERERERRPSEMRRMLEGMMFGGGSGPCHPLPLPDVRREELEEVVVVSQSQARLSVLPMPVPVAQSRAGDFLPLTDPGLAPTTMGTTLPENGQRQPRRRSVCRKGSERNERREGVKWGRSSSSPYRGRKYSLM